MIDQNDSGWPTFEEWAKAHYGIDDLTPDDLELIRGTLAGQRYLMLLELREAVDGFYQALAETGIIGRACVALLNWSAQVRMKLENLWAGVRPHP
jgi:hypothetical protein